MIRRLRHFLSGHDWTIVSAVFNPKVGYYGLWPGNTDQWRAAVGFTVILESCHCGATKTVTPLGDHSGVKAQTELETLNRMMR